MKISLFEVRVRATHYSRNACIRYFIIGAEGHKLAGSSLCFEIF